MRISCASQTTGFLQVITFSWTHFNCSKRAVCNYEFSSGTSFTQDFLNKATHTRVSSACVHLIAFYFQMLALLLSSNNGGNNSLSPRNIPCANDNCDTHICCSGLISINGSIQGRIPAQGFQGPYARCALAFEHQTRRNFNLENTTKMNWYGNCSLILFHFWTIGMCTI